MGQSAVKTGDNGNAGRVGLVLGPCLFIAVVSLPLGDMPVDAGYVAAVTAWMAVWWVTEAAPLAVTSLLPLVLFPLMGVEGIRNVAPSYADHMIFLFLGGFVLAIAVEKSGLHKRLAFSTLAVFGGSPRRLVWAFLCVAASMSMWLSDTATTLMLLPLALAVASRLEDRLTPVRVLLALAYGSLIGGIGTLVGTPPNLVFAGMASNLVPELPGVTFGQWMMFGLPMVAVMVPTAGLLLGRGLPKGRIPVTEDGSRDDRPGPLSPRERRAALLFILTAVAWITRSGLSLGHVRIPGWGDLLPDPKLASDAVPAVAAAILACLVPCGRGERRPLVLWAEIRRGVPWGILLLFGGGFALAGAFRSSGLDTWLVAAMHGLGSLPMPLVVLSVVLFTAFVTNLTSNTATATLMMPVVAALAGAIGAPPYMLMGAAAVSASLAFVLPVATPPNAIIMGSGRLKASDLFREGILLNTAAVVIVTVMTLLFAPLVLPA